MNRVTQSVRSLSKNHVSAPRRMSSCIELLSSRSRMRQPHASQRILQDVSNLRHISVSSRYSISLYKLKKKNRISFLPLFFLIFNAIVPILELINPFISLTYPVENLTFQYAIVSILNVIVYFNRSC